MSFTFRDALRRITPRWLATGLAEKILYAIGLHLDGIGDGCADGVKKRFPEPADDSIDKIGRDRSILRGPTELATDYGARMKTWLDDHRNRGGPYALLDQTGRFWLEVYDLSLLYASGTRFDRAKVTGIVTRATSIAGFGSVLGWANWWLVFTWTPTLATDGIWSDSGLWDDAGTWDSSLSLEDANNLKLVPTAWNTAHAKGRVVLLHDGAELWGLPVGLWGDPGTWGQGVHLEIPLPS